MSGGMLSRISGWRKIKKTYQGGGGYQKPHNTNHVREPRPPELFASKLDGRQPAAYNSIESPATTLTDDYESPSAVMDSRNELMGSYESPSKDSEWYQINSGIEEPLSNTESPEIIRSPSMSGLSPIDSKDPERILLSNRHALPLYSEETKGIPASDSEGSNGSHFRAPEEPSYLESRIDTNTTPSPNGKSPDQDNLSRSNPYPSLNSIRNNSPESITNNSTTGHMTESSDMTLDTQASETISDARYHPESTLENPVPQTPLGIPEHPESISETLVQQTPLEGKPEQPQATLDGQDHQLALAAISNHQESIFNPTERQESLLTTQDHAEFSPENPNPEPMTELINDRELISHLTEDRKSDLVTQTLPEVIPDESSRSESLSEERDHYGLALEEEKHPASTAKECDFPNYQMAISDTQSRSESIKSHGSNKGKDQQPLDHREAKLHRMRWRSLKTRALISEKRTGLRRLRTEMSDADVDFVKLSRQRWISGSPDDLTMKVSFEKLQATRDAYGPLEEEYNRLEERLDREEFELAELEEKMLKNIPISESQDTELESQSDSSDESDSETLEAIKEQQNPLYREFMSRLGDSGIHREAHSYLLYEHESLLEAEEVSHRYGREFPIEDQITLAKFDAREQKMSEEQREIDKDVERLRLECIRTGLLPGEAGEETDILQTPNGSVDLEQAEYNRFSRLLDQPGEDEDEKRSKELLSTFKSGDTGDRITRWLLHKLRSSCSEVELLARFTDGLDRIVDTRKWQEEVLYFWFMDSAILPPSAYELDPTVTAIPSSTLTDPNKVQHKPFGEKHFIELVVRSSSMSSALEFGMLLKIARMKGRSGVTT